MDTWDNEIAELRPAYTAVRDAKAIIKAEVRAKYKVIIEDEILDRVKSAEYKFAKQLADVKERSGIPVTVLQEHVFRTNSWSMWEKWRDLADIEPERVAKNTRASKLTYGEWTEDFSTLWVRKNPEGNAITPPLQLSEFRYVKSGWRNRLDGEYADEAGNTTGGVHQVVVDMFGDWGKMFEFVQPEVERQAALGNVTITPPKNAG